jgi:tetratricopeptide (TPR) repeat protein
MGTALTEGAVVRRRHSIFSGLLLVLIAVVPIVIPQDAAAQQPPATPTPATSLTPVEAERAFTVLLQRYFEAYANKDLEGMTALWHPGGPARSRRNIVLVEFDLRQVELAGLIVHNAGADPGGGRARAILELKVTDEKTRQVRHERRIRDFTFLQDDDGRWRIWNDVSPAGELARHLLAVPAAERDALIAADPELSSDDALAGLSLEAGRLQGLRRDGDVLDALTTLARLARALGNQEALGRGLIQIGSLHMLTGRYPDASEAFTSARAAFVVDGNRAETAACDANLANLAYIQGRFAEATERYQQAYEVFERLNDDARMESALHGLGNALYMQSEFTRALDFYTRAVTILQRTKDRYGEVGVLQAIAMVHKELGDYAPAIDAWRRSLAITEAIGDVAGTAKAWTGMGEIFRLQGDLGRALQHQFKSLQLWEQLKNVSACATTSFAIGQVYALQRNFPRALEFYQKALELDQSITDDVATSESSQARDLGGMAGAHFAQGQPEVALPEYERSLLLREKGRDDVGVMWTLVHMGVLHASQHRLEEAGKAYGRALNLAESKQDSNAASTTLALRGQLELDRGDVDTALGSAARAVELAAPIEHFDTVAFARVVSGRAHQKAHRFTDARASYEDAVLALAKVPIGPGTDTFFDNSRAPYLALVDLLAGQGDLAEAFLWSERGRQQALADILGGDGTVVVRSLTADERDLERAMARDLRALAVKIRRERSRQKSDSARLAALQAELAARQSAREELRRRLYAAHPSLREMRAQGEARGAGAASVLGTRSAALLSFVVCDTRTWVFAVARDVSSTAWTVQKAVAVEVKSSDLSQQVRRFREAIARKDDRAVELARELHALLLEPVQGVITKKTRLVVVPDAFLWSLPFEALQTSAGRYLLEDAAVAYAPSLTALAAVEAARPDAAARRSLVAFGRPNLGQAIEDRLALVRAQTPATAPPAADREVQNIAVLFGPSRSKIYLGEQARADRLAQGVTPGALLHLGVPTILTEAAPLYSLLALTPADSTDAANGLVEIASLMAWNLPAELTVASRVEYGPASGEGEALTALAWSLFVGGSPTLVVNRWLGGPADPNVAIGFYREHAAHPGSAARPARASESLQKAMKAILARPETHHPFYWAGFMTIGR